MGAMAGINKYSAAIIFSTALGACLQTAAADTHRPIDIAKVKAAYTSKHGKTHAVELGSAQNSVAVSKKTLSKLTAPGGSAAAALTNAVPGFQAHPVGSYSGASRYQIRINGTQVGFDAAGTPEINGLQILFDGIPLNNPTAGYHGFESNELPIASMFSAIKVTQGPGAVADHWYDGVGGTVNFMPLAPSDKASAEIEAGGGSFNSQSLSTNLQSGSIDGWDTVLSMGYTGTDGIRTGPTPIGRTEASAIFAETRKHFSAGSFTAGLYYYGALEHRAHDLPVYPVPGVNVGGYNVPGETLSQQTSGWYYTPSTALWSKRQWYAAILGFTKLTADLSSNVRFTDTTWYKNGHRSKRAIFNYNTTRTSGPTAFNYDPHSRYFGNRSALHVMLPGNDVTLGAYYMQMNSQAQLIGYNSFQAIANGQDIFSSTPDFYRNYTTQWTGSNVFLQDAIHPMPRLTITPGVGIEHYDVKVVNQAQQYFQIIAPGNTTAYVSNIPGASGSFTEPNFSLGLNAGLTHSTHLFATAANNYQTQTDNSYGVGASEPVVPPSKPAEVVSYIGGVKYHSRKWFAQAALFHTHVKDLTIPYTQSATQTVIVEPASETIQGVNFLLGYKQPAGLSVYTSDSIQDAREWTFNAAGDPLNDVPMTGTPKYNLGFNAGYGWYRANSYYDLTLSDRYQSATYLASEITSAPTSTLLPASQVNLVNLHFTDSTTAFNPYVGGLKMVKLALVVENLLNVKYNTMGYISSGSAYGPGSAGDILAQPGAPLGVYGSVSAYF